MKARIRSLLELRFQAKKGWDLYFKKVSNDTSLTRFPTGVHYMGLTSATKSTSTLPRKLFESPNGHLLPAIVGGSRMTTESLFVFLRLCLIQQF
jgi:hypothetical protein